MSISSARGRDLWELPECDAPLALTGVSAKGKGAGGGVIPATNHSLSKKNEEKMSQGVTPHLSNPSRLPAAVPRACSLLPG